MTPTEFRAARHELHLTQAQLADILAVDPRTIRRWEAGEDVNHRRPPHPTACRVMQWMLGGWQPPEL